MLRLFRSTVRGAAVASAVLAVGLTAVQWADRSPLALIVIVAGAAVLACAALVWALAPLREVPSDRRVARFIEERAPALDDRLVTAVDFVESGRSRSAMAPAGHMLAGSMLADAASRAHRVDLDDVLPTIDAEARGLARGRRHARPAARRVLLCGSGATVVGCRLPSSVSVARPPECSARRCARDGRVASLD